MLNSCTEEAAEASSAINANDTSSVFILILYNCIHNESYKNDRGTPSAKAGPGRNHGDTGAPGARSRQAPRSSTSVSQRAVRCYCQSGRKNSQAEALQR